MLGAVPGVNDWRTRRALAQQRKRYGMAHDLVNAASGHGGILNTLSACPDLVFVLVAGSSLGDGTARPHRHFA